MRRDKAISTTKKRATKQQAVLNTSSYGVNAALQRADTIEYGKPKFEKAQFERWEKEHLSKQSTKPSNNHLNETETADDDDEWLEYVMIGTLTSMALAWLFIPSSHPLIIHIAYMMKPFFLLGLSLYFPLLMLSLLVKKTRENLEGAKAVKMEKPVVITPKRVKKELINTNTLLAQSPMTATTDEQLIFADKANNQLVVNNVVISAFDKEKAIDLTIANEQLKRFLLTLESSILATIK